MDVPTVVLPVSAAFAAYLAATTGILASKLSARLRDLVGCTRELEARTRELATRSRELETRSSELVLAKARISAIVDNALDGIVVIGETGLIEGFNRAAERIFGYYVDEVLGQNVKLLMPEPFHSEHDGYLAAYKATDKPKILGVAREVIGRRKDGTTFPLDLAVGESRIEGSRLFAGIVRDITDRKTSDQLLKASEAKSRAILETAADAIITLDPRGAILTANPAAERIFGYRTTEMVGQDVCMLMPEPYRAAHEPYLKRYGAAVLTGAEEVLGRRKDGSGFPAELAVAETDVAGTRIFTEIVRDVSARKRTEDELRESEERFRLLVDNIRDYAIVTLAVDGTVKSWNLGSQRIYGWTAEEVSGQPMSLFCGTGGDGGAEDALGRVRECGRSEDEGWRTRKDGSRFWGHVIITPLWDQHGHMRGFVSICRDVTEQMEAERVLRVAKEAAERANHAKTKFLAAASHDLRQPVQALVLQVAVLEAKIAGNESAAPILTHVKGALAALNGLLESLLDVSRLEAGSVKPLSTVFPLSELVEQIVAECAPLARSKGIALKLVPTTAVVRTDAVLFGRILRNLVSNAIRYTGREGKVLVGCHPHGQTVAVQILDTGIGIAKDKLDEVFQEFYQVGNSERDRDQGLGLGLAIVRRLSWLLDCPVTVRSTEGVGSAFTVQAPLVGFSRVRNVSSLASQARHPVEGRGLIFIIDDENEVLAALEGIIATWGYEVVTAHTEDEAMAKLVHQPRPPDMVISDYRLRAGQTGADVIEHIRQHCERPIPSIVITGDTAPERIREAESHGLRLLHKPVAPELLQAEIARYFG